MLAVLADAENGEVVEAGVEAVLIGEGGGEGGDQVVGELLLVAAGEADQVVVALCGEVLVLHLAAAEVGDADEALFLQPGEDAVDGGAADVGEAGADEGVDLVGGVVRAGGLQGLQHEEALGRQALTLGVELFDHGLIGIGLVAHRSKHLGREHAKVRRV